MQLALPASLADPDACVDLQVGAHERRTKKKSADLRRRFLENLGGDLLSHTVSSAVPSAQRRFTSVFGMGTGGSTALWPPKNRDP